ncbi:MAG: FlgB family protein [Rhodobacteraceae bacterium]|nr:FlgB family protein [Paracoccaceae bacterium]
MFQNLEIFQLSHAMARHAAQRQETVAANMANADTPGYAARDLTPFTELVRHRTDQTGMRATRDRHIGAGLSLAAQDLQTHTETSPNGNNVSLEEEMMRAVSVRKQHDRALAIYRSSMNILRTSIGRR